MVIEGDGFRLRPLTLADADAWLAGEDDHMRRGFEFPRASTREDVVGAIEGWTASWRTGGPIRKWAITDATTDAIMGDVIAVAPPFEPFVIECKRPASLTKLEANLKKIRRQIDTRCAAGYRHGMGVIAIDRLVTTPESFPNDAALAAAVKRLMLQAGELLRPLYGKVGFTVDRVPCIGFLLVAASDDESLKSIHTTQRMTYWAPAPDARIDELQTRIVFARRSLSG
jgi:hypothetical protein